MEDTEVCKNNNAKFKCYVEPADARVKWFHNDVEVFEGSKYTTDADGSMRCLTIMSCGKEDIGTVTAMTGEIKTEAKVTVRGIHWYTYVKLNVLITPWAVYKGELN